MGLIPVFPVLHRMAQSLASETRLDIKREWVELLCDLLLPLLVEPLEFCPNRLRVRLQFVVRKP